MTGINIVECMRIFKKVVETGNFTRAAKELRISVAWTAKNVEKLETSLGSTLFIRSTRHLRLTEAGQICYDSTGRVMEELQGLKERLSDETQIPNGKIKIAVPQILAIYGMGHILAEFGKLYPKIKLDVAVNDRFVDLQSEDFDFVFRITKDLKDSRILVRNLGTIQRILCASPTYLKEHGTPNKLDDLSKHQCLVYSWFSEPDQWNFKQGEEEIKVRPNIHLSVNSSPLIKDALLSGSGIGYLPDFIIRNEMSEGLLVPLIQDAEFEAFNLYLLRADDRYQPTRARLFSEFIITSLQKLISA
ncbi:LysR family transcriptional regulator [Kiloniella antarctica]|uniref:LysR substrate-binding domain-containing protein n=1 Tax=Kiloniella antarctica TaxID=1550907 RepID=A0ABW5BF23_9PROT